MVTRCEWAPLDQPRYLTYHDEEWGVPVHDDVHLFEMLTLEGAQAGLSWITILRKRENYRRAYDNFDAARIARYDERDVARLLGDAAARRRMGEAGRARVEAHFGVDRLVDGTLDVYRRVSRGQTPFRPQPD